MAHVGGRSNYLPGQKIFLPIGVCCDQHPEIKALARIVSEVDTEGYEATDMCQECLDNFNNRDKLIEGVCDWCGSSDTDLKPKRDFEEGMSGRVYRVCESCIKKHDASVDEQIPEEEKDDAETSSEDDEGPLIDDTDDFDPDQTDRDDR